MYVVFLVLRGLLTSLYFLCKASRAVNVPKGLGNLKGYLKKKSKLYLKKINFSSFAFLNEIVWDKSMILV